MQLGHDNFSCGPALLLDYAGRDTAAVIRYANRLISVDRYVYLAAKPGQRLIDSVVHRLKYHMVQACSIISIADVHSRAFPYRLETFKDLDTAFVIDGGICHKYS